jgi:hypothetical protein
MKTNRLMVSGITIRASDRLLRIFEDSLLRLADERYPGKPEIDHGESAVQKSSSWEV